jgi:hypothetical protein
MEVFGTQYEGHRRENWENKPTCESLNAGSGECISVVANVVALTHDSNDVTAKRGGQCIRDELASKQVREHAAKWQVDPKGVGDL